MEMRINNEIDAADFIDQKNKLNAEIAEIESQFNAHQQSNAEWKDVLDYGKSYITDIRDRCESLKDVEKKVAYIGSIFPRGLVYDGTFLSNQQTLEIISSCNAPKRANVSSLSQKWNSFFDNLLAVHQKLQEQGFHYYNGKVEVLDQEEVSK